MKINHIIDRNWALYWNKRIKESNTYDLRLYRHKKDSVCGYRSRLVFHKKNYYMVILATDSKEEMKMTLDLMGLRIERITIIIENNMNDKIILPCSLIDLIGK